MTLFFQIIRKKVRIFVVSLSSLYFHIQRINLGRFISVKLLNLSLFILLFFPTPTSIYLRIYLDIPYFISFKDSNSYSFLISTRFLEKTFGY